MRNRNLIINFVAIGFVETEFKSSFAASIRFLFGILMHKDFTAKLRRNVSSAMFSELIFSASVCGLK